MPLPPVPEHCQYTNDCSNAPSCLRLNDSGTDWIACCSTCAMFGVDKRTPVKGSGFAALGNKYDVG